MKPTNIKKDFENVLDLLNQNKIQTIIYLVAGTAIIMWLLPKFLDGMADMIRSFKNLQSAINS